LYLGSVQSPVEMNACSGLTKQDLEASSRETR
jgi:hypothetical protein